MTAPVPSTTTAPAGATHASALDAVRKHRRLTNYLAAAQIYLRANVRLDEPLRPEHVKPRLLGHWGTSPGINLIHAGLDRLIVETDADVLLVTGVGHGAPANLANQWVDGTLAEVYPDLGRDHDGMARLVRMFSWPGGLPSHLSPLHPGVIHEGGELGYALAKSFGAAFDNPDLVVACIVGDGEFETGPTATAWHSTKFLNPAHDGAVLPFLHRNGYKIANPTVPGTMDDEELRMLFRGYGWKPHFVDGDDLDASLAAALDDAYAEIRTIQADARGGRPPERAAWPVVVVTSPKGWTGIKELDGVPIEGTWRAHQVPAADCASNPEHLAAVEAWLRSYGVAELLTPEGAPVPEILAVCPQGQRRMGCNPRALGGRVRVPLHLPPLEDVAIGLRGRGSIAASALETTGEYLARVVSANAAQRNFRIVSPDELESNKLGAVLDVTTRAYEWPLRPVDVGHGRDGRVLEMLAEHNCQGWLEGYVLTGRHGLFPSYEAFVEIVTGMANQLAKFLKVARELPWRPPVSSFNYLLTSEGWRQEHNGYSHQGPGFITAMLNKKASVSRVYLPPDANTLLAVMERCLTSTNSINLVVASKQPLLQWLTIDEARRHCAAGASEWAWAGTGDGAEPDIVFAAAGTIPTIETLAAVQLLRDDLPGIRTRFVNVVDLLALQNPEDHPHGLSVEEFEQVFTASKPVVFFFHGYPTAIHELVHHRPNPTRFHVGGYIEEGTTEPPFQLLIDNGVSRYDLAIRALQRTTGHASAAGRLIEEYTRRIHVAQAYIREHGTDPPDISDWRWSDRMS
ncbi:MAG TPA: phosphoketolase family protein [Acidimicrobiia bacterium]|nr:phosphoketolase family protein [Acidimicrobiia bacterium]